MDHFLKIVMLGDEAVGKTSIMNRYCDKRFTPDIPSTLAMELNTMIFKYNNESVKMIVWDMSGAKRFRHAWSKSLRLSKGIIFVYDITKRESFEMIFKWYENIKIQFSEQIPPFLLVGNKIDLECRRVVSTAEGRRFAFERGMFFIETSALEGYFIREAFDILIEQVILKQYLKEAQMAVVEDIKSDQTFCERYCGFLWGSTTVPTPMYRPRSQPLHMTVAPPQQDLVRHLSEHKE